MIFQKKKKTSSQYIEDFQQLSIMFCLTWEDIDIILTRTCTPEERNYFWAGAPGQEFTDELSGIDREHYLVRRPAVLNTEPHWSYQEDRQGRERQSYFIPCSIEEMKTGFSKPVHFDKNQEVTQGAAENLARLQGHLVGTIQTWTQLHLRE